MGRTGSEEGYGIEKGLALDENVNLHSEDEPSASAQAREVEYDLAKLLAGITPENLHLEVSFGAEVGKETL